MEIREGSQQALANYGGRWRAFEWNDEQDRLQLKGYVVGFEYTARGEDARRENGTAHGCLVAEVIEEEGDTNDPLWWELEQEPELSQGEIQSDEATKRTVIGAKFIGLMPVTPEDEAGSAPNT